MQELDDIGLLREYVERGSEAAFATLVERHINKVYSVALRHTGNPDLAEEITQAVFVILARKSRQLSRGVILYSWLYKTARLTSAALIRGEIRRARREQEACMANVNETGDPDVWPQIAPLLDTALGALNETDRRALMLRFFYGKSMKEIGVDLGANEIATKKRVSRALEKLQNYFFKHGVRSTTAALESAILANSVLVVPTALAKTVTAVAVAKGATASTSAATLIKGALNIMAWTKAKTAIAAGAVLILAAGTTTSVIMKHSHQQLATTPFPSEKDYFGENVRKVNQAKRWVVASITYASQHQNQLPKNFEELKTWSRGEVKNPENQLPKNFEKLKTGVLEEGSDWEIVSTGKWRGMDAMARTILLREKKVRRTPHGDFARTYAFADGHVELVASPDNDFAALEKQRGFLTVPAGN